MKTPKGIMSWPAESGKTTVYLSWSEDEPIHATADTHFPLAEITEKQCQHQSQIIATSLRSIIGGTWQPNGGEDVCEDGTQTSGWERVDCTEVTR